VAGDDLVLTSADGTEFAAYAAHPEQPTGAGLVIMPDVRGLHGFYKELARRFAEAGVHTVAFDYFGRTAGLGPRDDDFEHAPHVDQTTDDGVQADARAAVGRLRGLGTEFVFSIGFCFGGRASWVGAASGLGLAGSIGFYGSPTRRRGGPSVIERIDAIECPILALQAGDDAGITAEDNAAFEHALSGAGVEHEIVVYEGAPHSFFDRKQDQFADASADAWRRVLAFVDAHA